MPWLHRLRWANNELRIRELIQGANLNANFGYTYAEVPNRTRQREWEEAQARVDTTERQLGDQQEAVRNLRQRLELRRRQCEGRATKRAHQRVGRLRRELENCTARFQRRQRKLLQRLYEHEAKSRQLRERLAERIVARDAIDTETLCKERDLEKDNGCRLSALC